MRKLTTAEFIDKAISTHGYRYDYSESNYLSSTEKIKIKCKEHGFFYQLPGNHTSLGQGCPACGGSSRLSERSFIDKAVEIHGNAYDYSLVNYVNAHSKVKIICKEHGVFMQTPTSHISKKRGCSLCKGGIGYDSSSFINEARKAHGNKYIYDKVVYINQKNKVVITCKEHGDFTQAPSSHISGVGCRMCAKYGFNTNRDAALYVLKSKCDKYLKIGISHSHEQRLKKLESDTPFRFSRLLLFKSSGENILNMESKFHKEFKNAGFKGFDGATEWFHYDNEKLKELIKHGQELERGEQHES